MTNQTMQQAAAHHFGIPWDELNAFEQAHWEAAYRAGSAALIAENERLQDFKTSFMEWSDKTDWVQETAHWSELGKHRADVLKDRIDQLKAENERLQASLQGYQMGAQAEAEEADRLRGEVKELRKERDWYADAYRGMREDVGGLL